MNKKWQIYETDTEETKRIAEKYKINTNEILKNGIKIG